MFSSTILIHHINFISVACANHYQKSDYEMKKTLDSFSVLAPAKVMDAPNHLITDPVKGKG